MNLTICPAVEADIPAIASLRVAVAERLTREYGRGHWSTAVTEQTIARGLKSSLVMACWDGSSIVGTATLATRKPWAIDEGYFSAVPRPVCLHDMAVEPFLQRQGVGRRLLEEAKLLPEHGQQTVFAWMPTTARPVPVASTQNAAFVKSAVCRTGVCL